LAKFVSPAVPEPSLSDLNTSVCAALPIIPFGVCGLIAGYAVETISFSGQIRWQGEKFADYGVASVGVDANCWRVEYTTNYGNCGIRTPTGTCPVEGLFLLHKVCAISSCEWSSVSGIQTGVKDGHAMVTSVFTPFDQALVIGDPCEPHR